MSKSDTSAEKRTDSDPVPTTDDYRDLGALVNEHHDRPDSCRCWGWDGVEALSAPTEPCGPCERFGFTEPAPHPDASDTEDQG